MDKQKLAELLALVSGAGDFDTMLEERGHELGPVSKANAGQFVVEIDGKKFVVTVEE